MIRIFLGKLGSGKTLHSVKQMAIDRSHLKYYTNIKVKFKNAIHLDLKDIIKEDIDDSGKGKPKVSYSLNWEFWRKQKKPLHIIWDEIHLTASSRKSMSTKNMILMEFVAMARRIVGEDSAGYGTLTFIAQTDFSIEKYIRHLANEIVYHIMYWHQYCGDCHLSMIVNSEQLQTRNCPFCLSPKIRKKNFFCIAYTFRTFFDYEMWSGGQPGKHYVKRDLITDISEYFSDYDTHQEISG